MKILNRVQVDSFDEDNLLVDRAEFNPATYKNGLLDITSSTILSRILSDPEIVRIEIKHIPEYVGV